MPHNNMKYQYFKPCVKSGYNMQDKVTQNHLDNQAQIGYKRNAHVTNEIILGTKTTQSSNKQTHKLQKRKPLILIGSFLFIINRGIQSSDNTYRHCRYVWI